LSSSAPGSVLAGKHDLNEEVVNGEERLASGKGEEEQSEDKEEGTSCLQQLEDTYAYLLICPEKSEEDIFRDWNFQ
jgi:hypothetical protein